MLALLIGVHVKTLRAAARDGRLPVTYDTKTTFRWLRARATPAAARAFRWSYYGGTVRPYDRRAPLTWASVPDDYDAQIRALRRTRGLSQAQLATLVGARGRPWSTNGKRGNARRRPCSGNDLPRSSRPPSAPRGTFRKVERLWHTLDHADGLHANWDDPADRRDRSTRRVEPSMDRRLVHRAGREHLLARSCARQYQRVKLLLRDT